MDDVSEEVTWRRNIRNKQPHNICYSLITFTDIETRRVSSSEEFTNSMVRSLPWYANSQSASQEIPRLF